MITAALDTVLFTVEGTHEGGRPGSPTVRFLSVKLKSFKVVVRDAKGAAHNPKFRSDG